MCMSEPPPLDPLCPTACPLYTCTTAATGGSMIKRWSKVRHLLAIAGRDVEVHHRPVQQHKGGLASRREVPDTPGGSLLAVGHKGLQLVTRLQQREHNVGFGGITNSGDLNLRGGKRLHLVTACAMACACCHLSEYSLLASADERLQNEWLAGSQGSRQLAELSVMISETRSGISPGTVWYATTEPSLSTASASTPQVVAGRGGGRGGVLPLGGGSRPAHRPGR